MPVATLAILLAPAVSRPLSTGVADLLADFGDGSDSDGHLWMPLAVSALCVVPTLVAGLALALTPPPNRADAHARSAAPTTSLEATIEAAGGPRGHGGPLVDAKALAGTVNRAWFRRHWAVVGGLAVSSAALQGLGAVRDVFTADLVGADAPWWHSVVADAPACVAACLCYVPLLWMADNRRAFVVISAVGAAAAALLVAAGAASLAGWMSPLAFLVVSGVGHFFALVPFSGGGIVFERLMGASRMPVDTLLLNVACQVPAYVAGLGVLLLAPAATHPAAFFGWTAVLCGGLLVASCAWTLVAAFCVLPPPPPETMLLPPLLPHLGNDSIALAHDHCRGHGDDDDVAAWPTAPGVEHATERAPTDDIYGTVSLPYFDDHPRAPYRYADVTVL